MNPVKARRIVRAAIRRRPELRYTTLANQRRAGEFKWDNPYASFCYIATEAFCALVPEAVPYHLERSHFWAQIGDEVWDPTADQFKKSHPGGYPYEKGRKTRFKQLSWRGFELLREADPKAADAANLRCT